MPKNSQNKDLHKSQLSIDFSQPIQSKIASCSANSFSMQEAKIVSFDNRKEIYQRILNRSMK